MKPLTLPRPSGHKNTADQSLEMGLDVGDKIEGREEHHDGTWNERELTLVWRSGNLCVWSVRWRSSWVPEWSAPEESARWTLADRDWRLVGRRPAPPAPDRSVRATILRGFKAAVRFLLCK